MKKMENKVKKSPSGKRVGLGILCAVTICAAVYVGMALFFRSHFCFGTTIDGISVGGCGVSKVEQLITEEIDGYTLKLVEREGGEEEVAGASIAIQPVFSGEVEELVAQQNSFAWIVTAFKGQDLQLDRVVSYDETALEETVQALDCMNEAKWRTPVNAVCSAYSATDGYTLVAADYGTTINTSALLAAVKDAVSTLADELDLDAAGCYVEPQVGDDNEKLLAVIDEMNRYVGVTITYDFDTTQEVLDGGTISQWLSVVDLELQVDEEAVRSYVKQLGKTYNTAYQPKNFKTSYGQTVTISGGFYGWRIDTDGEMAQILTDLKTGESVVREPVYSQRANSHGETDYGDSYVEINLTAQHLFLYKDGKLIVESDFVSGDVAKGHSTPTGAFGITYTTTNATLRGQDYATPVNYWMPFNGDVGMHDATWRSKFGGNIYKTNGSHGCINLPLSVAKTIYENIDKGYAVLVYTLPGTESASAQKQDAETVMGLINGIGEVTLDSESAITNARNLYEALSDQAKTYVTNYDTLVAAEQTLAQLKGQTTDVQQTDASQTTDSQQTDTSQTTDDQQTDASQTTDGQTDASQTTDGQTDAGQTTDGQTDGGQ